jgi:hypothetical protein
LPSPGSSEFSRPTSAAPVILAPQASIKPAANAWAALESGVVSSARRMLRSMPAYIDKRGMLF